MIAAVAFRLAYVMLNRILSWLALLARSNPATLWVPATLSTSCDLLIFVEDAAESVVSLDLVDLGWRAVGEWS